MLQVDIDGKVARTVHGDPRPSNIYVRQSVVDGAIATGADFMFVNFDWAGHDVAVTYPATPVTAEGPGKLGHLRVITQQLDRAVLLATLRGAAAVDDGSEVLLEAVPAGSRERISQ